jgi:hypothetical protein
MLARAHLGRELVLWSLTETAGRGEGEVGVTGEAGGGGVGRGGVAAAGGRSRGGDCGGESSERRANTWVSGTELRLPYL